MEDTLNLIRKLRASIVTDVEPRKHTVRKAVKKATARKQRRSWPPAGYGMVPSGDGFCERSTGSREPRPA